MKFGTILIRHFFIPEHLIYLEKQSGDNSYKYFSTGSVWVIPEKFQ